MMVRVLIWDVPNMLREIITEILLPEATVEVVGARSPEGDLSDAIRKHAPHIILSNELDEAGTDFLAAHARCKVLTVGDEGRSVQLYRLRPEHLSLGNVTPEELVRAIRDFLQIPCLRHDEKE